MSGRSAPTKNAGRGYKLSFVINMVLGTLTLFLALSSFISDQLTATYAQGGLFFAYFPIAIACFSLAIIHRRKYSRQFQVSDGMEDAAGPLPIFGILSVAAPLVGGSLIYICMTYLSYYGSSGNICLTLLFFAVVGFISTMIAWKRHERYVELRWVGLILSLAPLIIALALFAPVSH